MENEEVEEEIVEDLEDGESTDTEIDEEEGTNDMEMS